MVDKELGIDREAMLAEIAEVLKEDEFGPEWFMSCELEAITGKSSGVIAKQLTNKWRNGEVERRFDPRVSKYRYRFIDGLHNGNNNADSDRDL